MRLKVIAMKTLLPKPFSFYLIAVENRRILHLRSKTCILSCRHNVILFWSSWRIINGFWFLKSCRCWWIIDIMPLLRVKSEFIAITYLIFPTVSIYLSLFSLFILIYRGPFHLSSDLILLCWVRGWDHRFFLERDLSNLLFLTVNDIFLKRNNFNARS